MLLIRLTAWEPQPALFNLCPYEKNRAKPTESEEGRRVLKLMLALYFYYSQPVLLMHHPAEYGFNRGLYRTSHLIPKVTGWGSTLQARSKLRSRHTLDTVMIACCFTLLFIGNKNMWCLNKNMLYTKTFPFQLSTYACCFSTIENTPLALLDHQKPVFKV